MDWKRIQKIKADMPMLKGTPEQVMEYARAVAEEVIAQWPKDAAPLREQLYKLDFEWGLTLYIDDPRTHPRRRAISTLCNGIYDLNARIRADKAGVSWSESGQNARIREIREVSEILGVDNDILRTTFNLLFR